jgi:hypothetical protein
VTTTAELIAALHLWLHREYGDLDLAAACATYDWSSLLGTAVYPLTTAQHRALVTLEAWYLGQRVALIDEAEDFHEAMSADECQRIDEQVVRLDGRVAFGWDSEYEEPTNVIPLRRRP